MMKNADKLKEKAEMAIQPKGWLSNVARVLYTVRQQKILMTWMSYLTKTDAAEQVWTLMVNFPVLGFFPVYCLTVSRTRKNHSQIPQ